MIILIQIKNTYKYNNECITNYNNYNYGSKNNIIIIITIVVVIFILDEVFKF